ncbi:Heat shock protein 60 family co-chaperone GroES [hydrothermal vent metagenome]|uniref:Heat shock protein 60 family co-chaperone GroES n=1 Tax=hydrothermal vent metagenome TaxID=652676 RepID=A0A1W1D7T6_9ZZZZ
MNIRPLHDRVIVRRTEEEKTTASGLIIPDSATEKPSQGEVLAVGKGKTTDSGTVVELDVKVGDTIVFGQFAGTEIKSDGETLLIMREDDIVAIID